MKMRRSIRQGRGFRAGGMPLTMDLFKWPDSTVNRKKTAENEMLSRVLVLPGFRDERPVFCENGAA